MDENRCPGVASTVANRMYTATAPMSAPSSGRCRSLATMPTRASLSSPALAGCGEELELGLVLLATLIVAPSWMGRRAGGPARRKADPVYRVPLPARLATVDAFVLSTMPGPLLTVS